MNLTLRRNEAGVDGIFGALFDETGKVFCLTLEHAYAVAPTLYAPKLPPGEYTCKRGMHQLAGHDSPFETFEILGVPKHTGVLFHVGNFNDDSSGCVLLGSARLGRMLQNSRVTFDDFIELQKGLDSFDLKVQV